jgi:pantoate--beta-alanine ligase
MGALHAGHIRLGTALPFPSLNRRTNFVTLVKQAREENDVVAISIFVNPAQFAPNEDFEAYPRTWDADREKIKSLNLETVAVFMPTKQEMYPKGIVMDVKGQRGAFVEVLGLSHQVNSTMYSGLTVSWKESQDLISSGESQRSLPNFSI